MSCDSVCLEATVLQGASSNAVLQGASYSAVLQGARLPATVLQGARRQLRCSREPAHVRCFRPEVQAANSQARYCLLLLEKQHCSSAASYEKVAKCLDVTYVHAIYAMLIFRRYCLVTLLLWFKNSKTSNNAFVPLPR